MLAAQVILQTANHQYTAPTLAALRHFAAHREATSQKDKSGHYQFGAIEFHIMGHMPSLTSKDPASHMLLVRDRFPQVYERTYKFLNVLDYLNLRLSGRYVATFDSIVTSWVTDNRNPDRIHYDAGLVRASGIDADKFPEIVPCTAVLGPLRAEAAEALGLPRTVQVVAGAPCMTDSSRPSGTYTYGCGAFISN